jgi:hypothetical protein
MGFSSFNMGINDSGKGGIGFIESEILQPEAPLVIVKILDIKSQIYLHF